MQTPLERAARALSVHNQGNDYAWQVWVGDARAVLQAIREPSPAMKGDGRKAWLESASDYTLLEECIGFAFTAMLDTALKDE